MLSQTLPPLPRDGSFDRAEQLEAFSLTYLAKYADSAPSTRVTDSYRRAWGIDTLKFFAATSTAPSWVMALYYPAGQPVKIIIAIAGVRSFGSLLLMGRLGESATPLSGGGQVSLRWKTAADAIYAQIAADADYQDATTHRRHTLTLAGYSMGAAVAEVLAAYLASADPSKSINLEKFASPRVGNRLWQSRMPALTSRRSMYVRSDPVFVFPTPTAEINSGVFAIVSPVRVSWFAEDDWAGHWEPNSSSIRGRPNLDVTDSILLSANAAITPYSSRLSSWHWHPHIAYRWHWMHIAYLIENALWGDRFLRLEHPDEFNWQTEAIDNRDWPDVPLSTAGSPPADFVIADTTLRAINDIAGRNPIYVRDTQSGAGAGGEWGFQEVPRPIRNARLIRRRPG